MTSDRAIDRHSPVPYYQQLSELLAQDIASGRLAVGDHLPSEAELGHEYGLARATIRQAMQALEARGLVHRVARRGVFVSEPVSQTGWMIQGAGGFLDDALSHQNRSVQTTVLRHGEIELPAHAARSLEVPAGSRGFEFVRVRSVDGVPAVFSTNYGPEQILSIVGGARDVLDGVASYSGLLARFGYAVAGAHRVIHALPAPATIARALDVPPITPILRIRSVTWSASGERYDLYETWVLSDVVPLEIQVSAVDLAARRS